MQKYPELTPYQFASNRPIDGVDLDGKEYSPAGLNINPSTGVANPRSTTAVVTMLNPAQLQIEQENAHKIWEQNLPQLSQYSPPKNAIEQERHDEQLQQVYDLNGLDENGHPKPLTRLSENKYFQNFSNRMALPIVNAYTYVIGVGEERFVAGVGKELATETFYRTMSEVDFAAFQKPG
jgi:hypothetical protein